MQTTVMTDFHHLKENPEYLSSLVDKYVKVNLVKNISHSGFLHCIDPDSFSLVLLKPVNNEHQTILIPGHAILDLTEALSPDDIEHQPNSFDTNLVAFDKEEIVKRKEKTMAWLKKNMLPVTECDGNIVFGDVNLLPPYTVNDISANNPVVALQIRNILEIMPDTV